MDNNLFDDLKSVVQYTQENGNMGGWRTMAAFDSEDVAERYAKQCSEGNPPWIYRVVPVPNQDSDDLV